MGNFFVIFFLLLSFSYLAITQVTVRCYECEYIERERTGDFTLNPDCLDDVDADTIQRDEGIACLKAEGTTIGGHPFVVRRAFHPGHYGDHFTPFPRDQSELTCEEATQYGNRHLTTAALSVAVISGTPVDQVTSCILCNDQDECNEATKIHLGLTTLFTCLLLTLAYLCTVRMQIFYC